MPLSAKSVNVIHLLRMYTHGKRFLPLLLLGCVKIKMYAIAHQPDATLTGHVVTASNILSCEVVFINCVN